MVHVSIHLLLEQSQQKMDNVPVRKYTSTVFINLMCGLSVIDMHKPEW